MRFDLVDLQLLIHVAEAGSITHGAARSHIALPSASERVRKMEDLAGVALLDRGRRGIVLTPAGRAFVHHARLTLQQIEHMKGELSLYAGGLKGHVRMQANASALSEFLPGLLKDFLTGHPGIDIDLEEKSSYDIVRSLTDGVAEIGIAADIVNFAELEVHPFATDRLVLVTPRSHALARRHRVSFPALLDHEFVGMAATNALQQYLGQQAAEAGKLLKLRVRLASFDAIGRMVGNGIGLAIMPESAARRCRRSTAIHVARLTDPWAVRHLHICVRRASELPPPARSLWQHLKRHSALPQGASGRMTGRVHMRP